jgi:hypothetical protein
VCEVDDRSGSVFCNQERGQPCRARVAGVVRVERDDEWVRQSGQRVGDGMVRVAGTEHCDRAVTRGDGGEGVDGAFSDDDLSVLVVPRAVVGETRDGCQVGRGFR